MKKFIIFLATSAILLGIWLLLAGNTSTSELITGSLLSLGLGFIFLKPILNSIHYNIGFKTIFYAIPYGIVFLVELIKSNIDVALRVINPDLPINPGIIKVKTRLKSPLGRLILANSITLTPGTLTVETKDDTFYIHWIDIKAQNKEEATKAIVRKFEKYLEVMFG